MPNVPIRIIGGMNTRHSPVSLFERGQGELQLISNVNANLFGEFGPLLGILPIGTDANLYPGASGDDGDSGSVFQNSEESCTIGNDG